MLTRMMHAAQSTSRSTAHTGSSAGLRAESGAVIEMAGSGYGSARSVPRGRAASLSLPRASSSGKLNHGPVDLRSIQHPKLSMDRQLSRLL